MSKFRLEMDIDGLRAFRNSEEITELIKDHTDRIAAEAGDSKPRIEHARTRVKGFVIQKQTSEDMENNTLLKAVHK